MVRSRQLTRLSSIRCFTTRSAACLEAPCGNFGQRSISTGRARLASSPPQHLTRERKFGKMSPMRLYSDNSKIVKSTKAYIALGSNLGDRVRWIEKACTAMDRTPGIKVTRTSSLWETKAMYVLDQDNFVNGACQIETTLTPIHLLDALQAIENGLGRVKVIDKGPRNIDLDILLYGDEKIVTGRLQVPHKLMLEREFVLRPLSELLPTATITQSLNALPPSDPPLAPFTPLSTNLPPLTSLSPTRTTRLMSIINLTPDSFSDGGLHSPTNTSHIQSLALCHIRSGAQILDLGGQSTRPNAPLISPTEELSRILPAISAILALPEAANIAISIDTFYASVARAAVQAGAHIINDVSAGMIDPIMLATVAELGCTVCLMHMRGDPSTMNGLTQYPDGLIPTIASELRERVAAAEEAGIRRWRIILDPGLGFAKNQAQNLEILRRMPELRDSEGLRGLPWLLGPSRKGFVGKVTGVKEASERSWGTAATVSASVAGGADVVRVHDVEEMRQVVHMADAVWRG